MRFSIYLNPQTRGAHEDVEIIETITAQAVEATRAGVDGIALTEHHFSDYNTYGNNFMLASYLAPQVPAGTKFALAVAVPTLHNPMRLAQSCNLLDILTRGELIVGFAAGGSPVEYAGLGRNPATRHQEMIHNLDVMEAALDKLPEDPPLEWETVFESGSLRTRIMPSAYHRSKPAFARGTQNDEGVTWTAARGWHLFTARETAEVLGERLEFYRKALHEHGHGDRVEELLDWSMVQKQVYLAPTDEEAQSSIRERMRAMADFNTKLFGLTGDVKESEKLRSVVGVSPTEPDEFLAKAMIVGSPASVIEQIEEYQAYGARHMSLLFNFGFMTAEESWASLRLFLDEVLPHFRGRPHPGVR
ncbi:MAG: LLM class flavin-dependent oxidoreductase [Nocardioidaceae bacterium]|nr:LLM class flavin-dependent oxidoreductase [Nocardioidaceae bacterium]